MSMHSWCTRTVVLAGCLAAGCGDNIHPGTAEVTVTPLTGLVTTESGGQAAFTVVLRAAPSGDVSIALSSSNTAEGTADASALTFTTTNWNAPQTVTITGINDDLADGSQTYTIITAAATSSDRRYDGVDPGDVSLTNIDNDSAGITVTPVTGLVTTESGSTASFDVVLHTKPTASVEIGFMSSDVGEGTVGPPLMFTTDNWNAPQHVTVTGVEDALADGPQVYMIQTLPAVSTDVMYSGLDAADVTVSNTDNDSPGITVTSPTGLVTNENGAQASFSIVLNSQPTGPVTIALHSNALTEGTASPTSITFTMLDWNAPQTITITGQDDDIADGNQVYAIVTDAATSTDAGYNGLDAADVMVTNIDNDTAGITVSPVSGLTTDEAGAQATFTIVLNSQPTAGVTIALRSGDTTEGTISPSSVTFTTTDWNAPQTITITGQDDRIADGNQPYSIITAPATSADPAFLLDAADVSVTNNDNDSADITVTPTSGLVTSEAGGRATFTIVLVSQPTGDVTIPLRSSDTTEGTLSVASVTFTTTDWNAPQTVTVAGIDDFLADGNQGYSVVTDPAVSADPGYANRDASNVAIANTDNDTAGITVTPATGLVTTEVGGPAEFTIVLNSQPSGDVTIDLSSSDLTEGTVAPASLSFTAVNWNAPRTVTVTGVDDAVADGNQPYKIITAAAVSTDAGYSGRDAADVLLTNTDNDTAGITVTPVSGLVTSEAGEQATFTIRLNSQPTADVTIALSSSDTAEGTPSTSSVVFTPVNWNAPQMVTITGVDDLIADGNQPYRILTAPATSADPGYATRDAADVSVTNNDNDTAAVLVNPISGLVTSEAGGSARYAVVLRSQPLFDVTIPIATNDATEGSVSPTSLTFTPVNWNAPQVVTVQGVDDAVADGNQVYTISNSLTTSADPRYNGLDPSDVTVTNIDNDSAGVTVTPTSGLTTTESAGRATFTIVLNSQPTADVTIGLTSSNTVEGTVTQSNVTFTAANWNSEQTITVTGVDDAVADGNQPYTIITAPATSIDPSYSGFNANNVALLNIDNDSASIIVSRTSGLVTTEAAGSDVFTVVLGSQPTADVTIALTSSDPGEGTVVPATLVFTSANWNLTQTVTVTGVDDSLADGNQVYTVVTAPATSADASYLGMNALDVSVTNLDNDIPGFTLDPTGGLVVSEFGDSDTFTIVLNTQPLADVRIALSSNDLTEGTVSPASVTFTAANWNVPQTVTVTGVNDALADGSQNFFIVTGAAVSTDAAYGGLNPPDIDVSNFDNDTQGVFIKARRLLRTTESGQGTTIKVRLTTQPTADVTCTFTSSDASEGTVAPTTLIFTAANFAMQQNITVAGVDDAIADGDQLYSMLSAPCTSADRSYNNVTPRNLAVINRDND